MEIDRRKFIGSTFALAASGTGTSTVAGETMAASIPKRAPLILVIDRNGNRTAWDEALEREVSKLSWSSPVVWRHLLDYVDQDKCKDPETAHRWSEISNLSPDQILDADLGHFDTDGRWKHPPESLADGVRERMIYDIGAKVLGVIACGDHPLDLLMAGGATTLAGSGFVSTHWAGRFGCLDWRAPGRRDCIHNRPASLPLSPVPEIARRVVRRLHFDARSESETEGEYRIWETLCNSYWA